MAFTIVGLKASDAADFCNVTLFISQEYAPHKERDELCRVLRDQEWQHPEPEALRYCRLGTLTNDRRVQGILEALLDLGAGEMGGHIRILYLDECVWLAGQLESWEDRERHDAEERAEEERRKMERRAPVYAYCRRCQTDTEQCKEPRHRGTNRCIRCCGGFWNGSLRHCNNCADLPYREKREAALGHPIVYSGEEA